MTFRRGLTLIETVMSVVLVGMLFGGAMNVLGQVTATRSLEAKRRLAERLCEDLAAEILGCTYLDPDTGLDGDGPASHEASTTHRLFFDDVDDFNGWKSSPPVERDGTKIPWASGFSRSVTVTKYSNPTGTDLFRYAGEVKIVTVRASHGDKELGVFRTVCVREWDRREREE